MIVFEFYSLQDFFPKIFGFNSISYKFLSFSGQKKNFISFSFPSSFLFVFTYLGRRPSSSLPFYHFRTGFTHSSFLFLLLVQTGPPDPLSSLLLPAPLTGGPHLSEPSPSPSRARTRVRPEHPPSPWHARLRRLYHDSSPFSSEPRCTPCSMPSFCLMEYSLVP